MKNLIGTLLGIVFILLCSCNTNEIEDLEREVRTLNDSLSLVQAEQNSLLDSISKLIESNDVFDINAVKMSQIKSLFEFIARQPEAADVLISASEQIYSDFTELLPFTDSTIVERGRALAFLFEAIARQPEAFDVLDDAATQFLGAFDPANMSSNFNADTEARGIAISELFNAIARQPAAFDNLDSTATKFMGAFKVSQMSTNTVIEGKARGIALNELFVAISRQPAAFDELEQTATKFLGDYDPAIFSDELIEISKSFALSGLNQGLGRNPESEDLLDSICIKFLNFSFLSE
ncbi:hypothetical protein [Spongiivirga citrea]|uniref:Uncharacterized protein n=1 Tax=Spongiivirga citrea TaxID=1481457 RepID=A0A6M0CFD4_9FLAO|nr:hypothetical protein [Spongiivirga citrea]NER16555.1 hypothetical protein [Spongiivirga citrea]